MLQPTRRSASVTTAASQGDARDGSSTVFLAIHFSIIAYVMTGWLVTSRIGLLAYAVLLPLIMGQWLVNGGSSIVSNFEVLARSGRWHDPHRQLEGAVFRRLLAYFGIAATQAQVNTVVVTTMSLFWMSALARMVLIVADAH